MKYFGKIEIRLHYSASTNLFSYSNVESKLNHCLHRDVITLREQGNSDLGNPTFSGVSEGNATIVSLSLQGNSE